MSNIGVLKFQPLLKYFNIYFITLSIYCTLGAKNLDLYYANLSRAKPRGKASYDIKTINFFSSGQRWARSGSVLIPAVLPVQSAALPAGGHTGRLAEGLAGGCTGRVCGTHHQH
jgi:hypothetical protein